MALSPQSIRKNVQVKFDDVIVDKQTIIERSESWTEKQEILLVLHETTLSLLL